MSEQTPLQLHQLVPRTLGTSALAMVTGWVALFSWAGLVEEPNRYLWPTLVAGILLVLAGSVARSLRVPWYAVPLVQIVVCGLFVNEHYASARSWHGVVPTLGSLQQIVHLVHTGAVSIDKYVAPVSADRSESFVYLMVGGIGILLAIDLLACGLGRVPLAGLPILLTLSIPISVLSSGMPWLVFVITSMLFLMLLATEETGRMLGWGRSVAGRGNRWDSLDLVVKGSSVRGAALRIGAVTTLGALVLPLMVPVAHDLFGLRGGHGNADGTGDGVKIVNPLVELRRNLAAQTHTPLVYLKTTQPDPSYLRLTALDDFDGNAWFPSARHIPSSNKVDGPLPTAPGLSASIRQQPIPWNLQIAPQFDTRWLPTPYPSTAVTVPSGDWRFDVRTLDIVNADASSNSDGLAYTATAANPQLTANLLNQTLTAPAGILVPMTKLPPHMPAIIGATAERVTQGADSNYQRAVKLQDWFRVNGGFRYSTARLPGSGLPLLAQFITTDKVGYCEQFAAAMAVMARTLGMPARVAVGFLRADSYGGKDSYVFTSDELHAWPEIYFAGVGWVAFEPTPGVHTGQPPSYTTGKVATQGAATTAPTAVPSTRHKPVPVAPGTDAHKSSGGSSTPTWLPYGALVLLLALLGAGPRLLRDSRRRGWLREGQDPPALAEGALAELEATATDYGVSWVRGRSVRTIARHLADAVYPNADQQEQLEQFVEFVERARYARPFATDPAARAQVLATVQTWSALMASSARPTRRRVATLFPPSVLRRRTTTATVSEREIGERV